MENQKCQTKMFLNALNSAKIYKLLSKYSRRSICQRHRITSKFKQKEMLQKLTILALDVAVNDSLLKPLHRRKKL